MKHWTRRTGRRTWRWGYRSGEWWVGARRNFPMDGLELNFLGLTLLTWRH